MKKLLSLLLAVVMLSATVAAYAAPTANYVFYDDEDGKYYVNPYGHKLPVDGHKAERLAARNYETQDIILGFRPEHVELVKEGGIPATIQVNEMMGSELHLHVLTETGAKLIVRVPTIRLTNEERSELVYGHKIQVTFGGKVMHFFDTETEESLIK